MFTKSFWKATAERTISTFAQAFLGYCTAAGTTDVVSLDWRGAAATAAASALFAVLKSVAASRTGDSESPSLGGGEILSDEARRGYGDGI